MSSYPYAWQHFRTITRHRHLVMKYCFRMGLYRQGLAHDLSKYTPTEFLEGAVWWQGTRSPNNKAREEKGYSRAWLHHKGRNKHHFEYWIDYGLNCDTIIRGVPIPRRYIAEMVADRISASRVYKGDAYTDRSAYEYFVRGKKRLWFVHKDVVAQLEFLLKMVADEGEDKAIDYIKNVYLKGKPLPDSVVITEPFKDTV
ncbi:MAG: DUF5662 family protein [Eubacteriales bacterium]|jgi:hypothetical protein